MSRREGESREGEWASTWAVARVRALAMASHLPPLQAEELVEGPPWPPAPQTRVIKSLIFGGLMTRYAAWYSFSANDYLASQTP